MGWVVSLEGAVGKVGGGVDPGLAGDEVVLFVCAACSIGWCCAEGGRFLRLYLSVLRRAAKEGSATEVAVVLGCVVPPLPSPSPSGCVRLFFVHRL